jgi:hypothetical protein
MQWKPWPEWLLCACGSLAVAACGTVPLGEPDVDVTALPASAGRIDTHATRDDVRALLGAPWLVDERHAVEVYRREGRQRALGMVFVLPVPVPSDTLRSYALVAYGDDGRVVAYDAGHARAEFGDPATVVLRAGEFRFAHSARDTLWVSREAFAGRRASSPAYGCTLLIGCDASRQEAIRGRGHCNCSASVSVDASDWRVARVLDPVYLPPGQLSDAECRRLDGIPHASVAGGPGGCVVNPPAWYAVALQPGRHELRFRHGRAGEVTSAGVDCNDRETWVATLGGRFLSCLQLAPLQIERGGEGQWVRVAPGEDAAVEGGWVVLYDDGTWTLR